MAKVHVFIVFKLKMSSDLLYGRELSKTKNELKKIGMVYGRWSMGWSMGWSMEGFQGVVHGLGSVFSTLPSLSMDVTLT